MDEVSKADLQKAMNEAPEEEVTKISDEDFEKLLVQMEDPVKAQKKLAVQIKTFLDARIQMEMNDKGILSDHTRRWVESYNNILEKIQKALHGDKSVNLHLHKVSHSDISSKIRESTFEIVGDAEKKKKKKE